MGDRRRLRGRQAFLARLENRLRPAAVQDCRDPLAPAALGDALLAVQAPQHDPDLLFGRVLLAGTPADVLHDLLGRRLPRSGVLSHPHSVAIAMSRKPSVPKSNQV
jgi:hypothetical protein